MVTSKLTLSKTAVGLTALFMAVVSPAAAQLFTEISFCPAGLQPDGFVDWTKLPVATNTTPVTATIPVSGVQNLDLTFQATPGTGTLNPFDPIYQAINAADLRVRLSTNPIITFSRPIKGLSVTFQTSGRFGHSFKMTAYSSAPVDPTSPVPPDTEVDSASFDWPSQQMSVSHLQIRSTSANIAAVIFRTDADNGEYFGYDLINLRIETGSAPDPAAQVTTNGLREWLRADRTNTQYGGINFGSLISWPDQSGHGSDALPPNTSLAPSVVVNGPNCNPVVSFGGPNQLNVNLPINGWTGMTVFLASQAFGTVAPGATNQALFWDENRPWGRTYFAPAETGVGFRFGTTQVNNGLLYNRPTIGGDFSVTTAIHAGNTDSLWVNGDLVLQQGGKLTSISGTVSTATIGAGLYGAPFTGNIGEILIYDRALSSAERATVERYLMTKYGIR